MVYLFIFILFFDVIIKIKFYSILKRHKNEIGAKKRFPFLKKNCRRKKSQCAVRLDALRLILTDSYKLF